ncbi:MAG: zinc-binding dehydrogenase, partial [Acidobacteria bacterium]|nr:zinc-binding dehydrogenase [Acidobacteriota bacterium]
VAVLGDGKLGLLISQVLHARGLRVHQFGRHREKLRIAGAAGVQTHVAGAKLPKAAYDWIVEATGSPQGLADAVRMCRPRGTVILKSTTHGAAPFDTAPVIVQEISLVGSRCGRFEPALELLQGRVINVKDMISGRLTLSQAPQAFERAALRGVLKVLLEPD